MESFKTGLLKNRILADISGRIDCPVCEETKLYIGNVLLEEGTPALFCSDCEFRAAIPIIITSFGNKEPQPIGGND